MKMTQLPRPNWYDAALKAGTVEQAENLHTELMRAASLLVDLTVRDVSPVLVDGQKLLDLHIDCPTTFVLPAAVRGRYGSMFARLWMMTASNVCLSLIAGAFEVAVVAEALMLDVAFELVSTNAELHPDDYLPPRWDEAIGPVMAPRRDANGRLLPVWREVIHQLDPAEWFVPEHLWERGQAA